MAEQKENVAYLGLNTNSIYSQIKQGQVTHALNAQVEGFDGKSITYQNEQANQFCCQFPVGFKVIGNHSIIEKDMVVFWLINPITGDCQIGRMFNNDCKYRMDISSKCLNFNMRYRIRKAVHKITNCSIEVYWTDTINGRRWIDFNNLPFTTVNNGTDEEPCDIETTPEIDCNKLAVQPDFTIPQLSYRRISSEGSTPEGTYQFAIQYCNSLGEEYTSYFSVTNPIPLFDPYKITENFNELTNQAIQLDISDLDTSGIFQYFNLAVIKNINNIVSVDLVATYQIERSTQKVIYTGQSKADIELTIDDIFEKFPVWDQADDVTAAQDILIWTGMTSKARQSYQKIFNKVNLNWCSYRVSNKTGKFKDPLIAAELRGYMRDEVYAFDAVLISKKGYQSDRFPIPGRPANNTDRKMVNNADTQWAETICEKPESKEFWEVYNTASVDGRLYHPCGTDTPTGSTDPSNPSSIIQVGVSLKCTDKGCTEQGTTVLTFNLPKALTAPMVLQIGHEWLSGGTTLRYLGKNIFTPSAGATPDPYFTDSNVPFEVTIPAGVITFTTEGTQISQPGITGNNKWICQSCQGPEQHLWLKAKDGVTSISGTTDGPFAVTVINPAPVAAGNEQAPVSTISTSITATNTGSCVDKDGNLVADDCYVGPYEFGQFAFWESTETYPCNEEVWGELSGQKIRHHKFPDSTISHHYDNLGNIYPLGVRINMEAIHDMIRNSPDLSEAEKEDIAMIKIVRSNRANSKSVIAKGMLYNVGKYRKDSDDYFYPNYPFNDLRADPFISVGSNAPKLENTLNVNDQIGNVGTTETVLNETTFINNKMYHGVSLSYEGVFHGDGSEPKEIKLYKYDPYHGFNAVQSYTALLYDSGPLTVKEGDKWFLDMTVAFQQNDKNGWGANIDDWVMIWGINFTTSGSRNKTDSTDENHNIFGVFDGNTTMRLTAIGTEDNDIVITSVTGGAFVAQDSVDQLDGFGSDDSRMRYTFHSPDTSFYQPHLGNILKFESIEFGTTKSQFYQVKKHARYKFPSIRSYLTSLLLGVIIGFASGTYGVADNIFNGTAAFTAFTTFNDIIYRLLPRKNFAYSYNGVATYDDFLVVPNNAGVKIRQMDIAAYLSPGMIGVGDTAVVNNYQRESSVYIRTTSTTPFTNESNGAIPQDNTRYIMSQQSCTNDIMVKDTSAYYGSIKVINPDQYGEIYSYEAVDTGFQYPLDVNTSYDHNKQYQFVFGGDTYINQFSFKRKLPFFLDNRVDFPDDADISYNDVPNIGFPTYWFSTDIAQGQGGNFNIGTIFGVKVNNFDCKRNSSSFFYDAGKIYLFAYGIPTFYVESAVNVDYRQAVNAKEGDFYPRVASNIPDEWLQEINVSINYDNTYIYNKSFSKQNIENKFTTLPIDFIPNQGCQEYYPNKSVYSEKQEDVLTYKKNNWLVYRPVSYFDFPLNYGKLVGLEGITDRAILAKFENKSMMYNAFLTISTNNPKAAYIGNDTLFKSAPPIDFVETDLGYVGTQHEFFLRTEYGNILVDAKRGQVFLISGTKEKQINDGMEIFFQDQLKFQLQAAYPSYDCDNHYKGVGLHGTYDSKHDRFLMTKLDYVPNHPGIIYNEQFDNFTYNDVTVELTDKAHFCSVSFTLSYSFLTNSWISFHSYLPSYYVDNVDQFYAGRNDLESFWVHNKDIQHYNSFFGKTEPYILEYPFSYKQKDEILQSVSDYTKVNQVFSQNRYVQVDDAYFNKAVIYNDQQTTGILNLVPKPKHNIKAYLGFPKLRTDSKDIMVTKRDNSYYYNGFWDVVKDYMQPIWDENCVSLPTDKQLDPSNLEYNDRSYRKYTIRAKDARVRHILDNRDDIRMISEFVTTDNQDSYI